MKLVILTLLFAFAAAQPVDVNVNLEDVVNGLKAAGKFIGDNTQNVGGCADDGGCFNGYCWAKCGIGSRGRFQKWDSWCYTTKTYSQSFDYVRCRDDSDCNKCWKCAGSCTM